LKGKGICHGCAAAGQRSGDWRGRAGGTGDHLAFADGARGAGLPSPNAVGVAGRSVVLRSWRCFGCAPSDGAALRGAGDDGRLLAKHARQHGPAAGHVCLADLAQGTVCKILDAGEVKPQKVRYYLERRDPAFAEKMAEVLCVYREVKLLKKRAKSAVAIVSYDEKPGMQAIGVTAPDLPPVPGIHPTVARDHEYKRHGTVSLLAGIDLLTGKVHALVKDRHRSREFIEFLKLLDGAYPTHTAIKVILDNHSAHISKETRGWLAAQRSGRFEFVFTPTHGSWLNLVEGFFSKLTRSVLRHIRVASKQELKDRIMTAIDLINHQPVVHTWSYMLDRAP